MVRVDGVGRMNFRGILTNTLFKLLYSCLLSSQKSQASAQQVIAVLNSRIEQKDGAIKQFQEVLRKMREDARGANEKHQRELEVQSKQHAHKVD